MAGWGADLSPPTPFDRDHAERYDTAFQKLAPFMAALHLCLRGTLGGLRHDAHILCVGAGTGAELLYLAGEFPGWQGSRQPGAHDDLRRRGSSRFWTGEAELGACLAACGQARRTLAGQARCVD